MKQSIFDGWEIEKLAISMAAGVGVAWPTADLDTVTHYRICANAALVHFAANGRDLAGLGKSLEEAAQAGEAGAMRVGGPDGEGPLEDRLFKAAAYIRQVGRVLEVLAPEEAAVDPADPGDVI